MPRKWYTPQPFDGRKRFHQGKFPCKGNHRFTENVIRKLMRLQYIKEEYGHATKPGARNYFLINDKEWSHKY